jgi:hypothetical protein
MPSGAVPAPAAGAVHGVLFAVTGTVAIVAFITDPAVVRRILAHLHLPT